MPHTPSRGETDGGGDEGEGGRSEIRRRKKNRGGRKVQSISAAKKSTEAKNAQEIVKLWEKLTLKIVMDHPDTEVMVKNLRSFKSGVIDHYSKILDEQNTEDDNTVNNTTYESD